MPASVSPLFQVKVVRVGEGAAWLSGNGTNWDDGSFNTLQGIVNAIGPAGGWGQLPNTALTRVLLTKAEADAIDRRIWSITGATSVTRVWSSAAWTGKSFLLGACGGHGAYQGNEVYRVAVTDPPRVARLYNPAPLAGAEIGTGAGDRLTAWGPPSNHHYDGWFWHPVAKRACWAGSNRNYVDPADNLLKFVVWSLNLDAPTPQNAWQHSVPAGTTLWNNPAAIRDDIGFPGWAAFDDDEAYLFNINGYPANCVFSPLTQAIRQAGKPPDPWARGALPGDGQYLFLRRAGNRLFYSTNSGTNPLHNIRYFDIPTGQVVRTGVTVPSWYSHPAAAYSTIAVSPGGHVCGWLGRKDVWHFDSSRGQLHDWTMSGLNDPTFPVPGFGENGIMGKWAYCSGTAPGCFVGITACNKNVHVFRPPAAWNVD
jgi:hypothetical protein